MSDSVFVSDPPPGLDPARAAIRAAYRADETACVDALLAEASLPPDVTARIEARAAELVVEVRKRRTAAGLDAFLAEYDLSSREGVVLMCLAEALLRIPDAETADALIKDKLADADWRAHLGQSGSAFVNAATWALMLTGRVIRLGDFREADLADLMKRLVSRSGEPVIRQAVLQAMRIMGRQFVMGRDIDSALDRARDSEARGYRYSYDMLGEAARTAKDAERYFDAYTAAIGVVGKAAEGKGPIEGPGVSVKLSALHPRYEFAQRDRVANEVLPRIALLARLARDEGIGLCIDAEEADRLEPSLDVIAGLLTDSALAGWDGLGLAVQGYQKRARPLIDWLVEQARAHNRRLMVRLTKGAYWDAEIKRSQEQGLAGYPVFTRKGSTDVSFLACARALLAAPDVVYPQFASHNAHTVAVVMELAGDTPFEFQRLHGMGEPLFDQLVGTVPCRVYAPVGSHEDLLAYLVRRLLENGANTSFVNRIVDEAQPVADIVADPVAITAALETKPHPKIPLPRDIYRPERLNARGVDLSDPAILGDLAAAMAEPRDWRAGGSGEGVPVTDPADLRRVVGHVVEATTDDVANALEQASVAAPQWNATPATERAACLDRMADLLERDMTALMALAVREAGKTLNDSVAEVREAVDFCRYYAARARADFAEAAPLPGPTGERNQIALEGRGVFACISPWNFPLAIFCGQVTAALAAGNAVVAKPAEQTPLIAAHAVRLLHEAGVPADVLHLLPGPGETVGAALVGDPRIAGVAFTGSTATAQAINRTLAARDGPIVPLIAETGGQNCMLVDSSALPEQVVRDVLASAFQSAGQRCSALRFLFVQADVADRMLTMLAGAMAELKVGDPALLATDVGPVIDADALAMLEAHAAELDDRATLIQRVTLGPATEHGTFFAPCAYEVELGPLGEEVFGPILHVVRYAAEDLDAVLDTIDAAGYGLTLGIHSRIDAAVEAIHRRLRIGNTYVNRNQIGAVVGVQPFGGEGLSGTGPKAGGPRYLHRFATERTLTVDTTAQGGNAALMSLDAEG